MRIWFCHLSRWGNKWGSIHWDNLASATEMWLAHCIAQRACGHTQKTPNCQLSRWYTVLMPPPFLFCQNPDFKVQARKNVQLLPDSLMPPKSSARGRSPSSYGHSGSRSQCRSESLCPSFWPAQLHYTTHSDWVIWHPHLVSLTSGYEPLPPKVGESA